MTDILKPRDAADVEEAVRWALGAGKTLALQGHGSKAALGRPAQSDLTLDLSALAGVTLYEPEELVLSARAGTPIADIAALLASRGQELAFEPLDHAALLGGEAGRGTLAGTVAVNAAGPRRIKAGAARDHVLGVNAVSGRGETFKTGGRVVKNVTGYDLCKVLAGSWGTLAVMTEITVKVLPRAETEDTLLVRGEDEAAAAGTMAKAMGSSCEVSGAAHVPAALAGRIDPALAGRAVTALRLEGVAPSVAHRRELLETLLRDRGPLERLGEGRSRALWTALRDVAPLAGGDRVVWRLSTAPMHGHRMAAAIAAETDAERFYDWAGGLLWLALPPGDDAGAALVRRHLAAFGGHATLVRAPAAVRAAVDVFEPQPEPVAALTRRLKDGFDPQRVLEPGRMYAGV